MTDPHDDRPIEESLDQEIGLKAIFGFGIGILLLIAAAGAITWWFGISLRENLEAQDPPTPALIEARWKHEPPGPRLQAAPAVELLDYRTQQDEILAGYAWVDEAAGIARVPVDRAIELALEQGIDPPVASTGSEEPAEAE